MMISFCARQGVSLRTLARGPISGHSMRALCCEIGNIGRRSTMIRILSNLGWAALVAAVLAGPSHAAQYLEPSNAQRSYGAGVVTEGGRIVWLAGMGGTVAPDGKKIADFAGQTRRAFQNIEAALKRAGGSLDNLVSMTVMIRNQSDGDEFVRIRGEFFKNHYPASMLITAKDFANPDLLVEIQSVAVIGDQLK
jgi:enamine deaminase RidA (YjgF/YER057c/UK114 family)